MIRFILPILALSGLCIVVLSILARRVQWQGGTPLEHRVRLGNLLYRFFSWVAVGLVLVEVYNLLTWPQGLPNFWIYSAGWLSVAALVWLIGRLCRYVIARI